MSQSDFNIGNSGSLILEGTVVKGDIFSDKNVCLKGTLTGNVHCKATFFLPAGAKVEGNVSCADLLSAGLITGDVQVSGKACLKESAVIKGHLVTSCLLLHPRTVIEKGLKLQDRTVK
ncbi:polymer-forming cytoskeletal protein [Odoribacter laneus]|uniref:polymer-forming cytoskeletal protein n=2 Tax=Odoribacter laneus TaxID=626933 RepID=UPI003AB8CE60